MASVRTEIFARRLNLDADRVVRRAVWEARRAQLYVKRRALMALRKGERFEVRDKLLKLAPLLEEVMLASHAVGLFRGEQMRPKNEDRALSLATFDAAVDFLRRRAMGDFDQLKSKYGTRALNLLNGAADHVENELASSVAEAVAQGVHVREGMQILNDRFEALGLGTQKSHLLETLFRTNTQMAFGAGRWEADQDPDVQEILWGYEYSAVGDERTRETHMAMDGTTLPKDDPFWKKNWPPNGWNCRCAAIAQFEPVRERRPKSSLRDGTPVEADRGFGFNAGELYRAGVTPPAPSPGPVSLPKGPDVKVTPPATPSPAHGLSDDELKATRFYTTLPAGESTGHMQRLLSGDDSPKTALEKNFVTNFKNAANKLPVVQAEAYRGIVVPGDSPITVGKYVTGQPLESWTADPGVARGYAITRRASTTITNPQMVVIQSKGAWTDPGGIIQNPEGRELWRLDSRGYTVKAVREEVTAAGKFTVIEVEPATPQAALDFKKANLAERIAKAKSWGYDKIARDLQRELDSLER